MRPYHLHHLSVSNVIITLLFVIFICITTSVNAARFATFDHNNNKNKLQFITEPESLWASADGRRITFKCIVQPPEAQIKWLLNGTIINDDSYEWIKMTDNKLSFKLQKTFDDNENSKTDHHHQQRSHHSHHHHHHHRHQNNQQNINLQGAVFQCVAELNDQVIVSQPAKLIIAELSSFDEHQQDKNITAISGNSAVIPCELPHSIPLAVSEFEFNNITISNNNITQDRYRILPSGHLLITNAKPSDSGSYRCIAHNPFLQEKVFDNHVVNLKVIKQKHSQPELKRLKYLLQPKSQITAILGSNITLECVAHAFPIPKISWTKVNGELPRTRTFIDNGVMVITTVQKDDEGIYSCGAFNSKFTLESNTELKIYEMPQIINDDYEIIEMENGQNYELYCNAKGQPKPLISWLHNGYFIDSQITNDVFFEQEGTLLKIVSANPQIHGGIFQCFATNELGTTYAIKVIQFKSQINSIINLGNNNNNNNQFMMDNFNGNINRDDQFNSESNYDQSDLSDIYSPYNNNNDDVKMNNNDGHNGKKKNKNKDLKLIPPSKPEVSKLNDDSVMVRWHVPKSTGLPIMFFKVQYKELGRGDWNTVDVDIPPHIFSFQVCCLNPNSTYRFRIAAVYSNDDNKNGKSSNKFVFQKDPLIKRPINPPTILNATSLSPYDMRVEWEFLNIDMQRVDGFFINYRATDSAGQYLMVTAMGSNTRHQNISFLQPNTAYDIKMQCFNEAGTSDFSNIYTVKTMALETNEQDKDGVDNEIRSKVTPTKHGPSQPRLIDQEKMQLIAILVVTITALLVVIACVIICCVRQKSNQSPNKIKKEKSSIKSPSDYYFSTINNYDRRLSSNGQLNTISGSNNIPPPHVSHHQISNVDESDSTDNQQNSININQINNELPNHSLLNRRNSFRNSLSYSSHHLYSSNNNIIKPSANENHLNDNGSITATIDRKKPLKNSIPGPYLDQYSSNNNNNVNNNKINHHSASFTRLNGTLERKRRSRHDLNSIDKTVLYNANSHRSNLDLNRQCSNGNGISSGSSGYFHHSTQNGANGGHFVIMQSSC